MIGLLLTCLAALGAEPLLLDAGSVSSPLLDGFSVLHREGAGDPRVSWDVAPSDSAWCGSPDPLAGDHIEGGRLRLDLDPGEWVFHVLVGRECAGGPFAPGPGESWGVRVDGRDVLAQTAAEGDTWLSSAGYAAAPFPVFRPGETGWERQVVHAHPWRTFTVTIGEGGATLETFGLPLQAILAAPSTRAAEAEVLRAVADAQRQAWFVAHVDPLGDRLPPLGEGPLSVQVTRWDEGPEPSRAGASPVIRPDVTPGERFSVLLWVFPGDGPAAVEVRGLDGVEVYEVHWLDGRGHGLLEQQPRPAFLRPSDGAMRGEQGVPVGVALAAQVPADARPGALTGEVVVTRGDESVVVRVDGRVRDLALVPVPTPVGFFADLRLPVGLAHGTDSQRVWDVYAADLEMMRARGLGVLGLRRASPSLDLWKPGSEPDTALFRRAAEMWDGELIWVDPALWLSRVLFDRERPGDDPDVVHTSRLLAAEATSRGAWLLLYDERGHKGIDHVRRGKQIAEAIRAEQPDARLMAAALHPVSWPLAGSYGAVAVNIEPGPSSRILADLRAAGAEEAWLYNLTPGRSASGLLPWLSGADGLVQWHWNNAVGDPFNDVHRRAQLRYTLLAPGGREVWPTPLLESFTDGLWDQRYLATLEATVVQLEQSPTRRRRQAAAPGRRLLDVLREADGDWPIGPYEGQAWSDADLERIRQQVGDTAEALHACLVRRKRCPR